MMNRIVARSAVDDGGACDHPPQRQVDSIHCVEAPPEVFATLEQGSYG